jgi:superfamily I DNA and/or RNA helicase
MAYNEIKEGTYAEYTPADENKVIPFLKPGYYRPGISKSMFGEMTTFKILEEKEKLVPVISESFERIINDIPEYFNNESKDIHQKMGFTHKLGVLVYGSPGTGKTKAIEILIKKLIKYQNAIALDVTGLNPGAIIFFLQEVRKNHPDTLLVAFMDDAENVIRHYEDEFLGFLDGGASVDKFLFIATTNYIAKIPDRISKRPSRFKYLIEHEGLPYEAYHQFISEKMKPVADKVENYQTSVNKLTDIAFDSKYTLDFTKHLILDYVITGEIKKIDASALKPDDAD